jgi:hypothetical protein
VTLAAWPGAAPGEPITIIGPFHHLENRSTNSINVLPGLRQTFGAVSVVPNGDGGTSGTASQGAFLDLTLNFTPFDVLPNHFVTSRPADIVPNGAWTLTFTNGGDTATATTPTIAGAAPIGFVAAMSFSSVGGMPTFSWTPPATGVIDTQRVQIYDTTELVGTGGIGGSGVANIIFSQDIGASATNFTVNPALLVPGRLYSFELTARDLRNNLGGTGLANALSTSRSFFDFALPPGDAPAQVFLPTMNTSNPTAPVYEFREVPASPGTITFIDPLVAVGYDYQIAVGDPNFASVLLPTGIGDNLYQLLLWDGDSFEFETNLTGGIGHAFGPGGVDRFRILGIETSALLDPFSAVAFITGLTFVSEGTFSGTMTPLTEFVSDVPIPAALPLFATGLGLMGLLGWRRKRKVSAALQD